MGLMVAKVSPPETPPPTTGMTFDTDFTKKFLVTFTPKLAKVFLIIG